LDGHSEGTSWLVGEVVIMDMKMIKLIVTHEKIQVVDEMPGMGEERVKISLQSAVK
jgi:hypothetical protein